MSLIVFKREVGKLNNRKVVFFTRIFAVKFKYLRLSINWFHSEAELDRAHHHASSALSMILSGGYTETRWTTTDLWKHDAPRCVYRERTLKSIKKLHAPSIRWFDKTHIHKLSDIKPRTITMQISLGVSGVSDCRCEDAGVPPSCPGSSDKLNLHTL